MDVTAEIGRRGEVEHLGNVHETEAPVSELAGNVQDREPVDPPVGRIARDGLADFGKVLRSNAKFVRIIDPPLMKNAVIWDNIAES